MDMSNKNNLGIRLNYRGGAKQLDRMNIDKLKSLKKALLYSYQAATIILLDGREFRCLINSDKLNLDLDNKILSIPFKGVRLNSPLLPAPPQEDDSNSGESGEGTWEDMEDLVTILTLSDEGQWENMGDSNEEVSNEDSSEQGYLQEEDINIKEGDVIQWKENNSYWIIYLQYLEETAYFRANLRRCHHQVELENGSFYWVYIRGPVEQSIVWQQGGGNYLNKLNNTVVMYITKTKETEEYFHRFAKVKINGDTWEVQAVDKLSTPGIIEVALKEDFNNSFSEAQNQDHFISTNDYITGSLEVYPYDTVEYSTKQEGKWTLKMPKQNMVKIIEQTPTIIKLFIATGRSGEFTLSHSSHKDAIAAVKIKSL